MIDELTKNLATKAPHLRERFLALFGEIDFEVRDDPPDISIVIWRDAGFGTDAPILAAASLVEVDAFCTGDRGILSKMDFCGSMGLHIVTPRELHDRLSNDRP